MRALVLLGVAVAASFVAAMLWTTDGHFVAQISDLYVVAQYARAMAQGHPFQYNVGDAPTTGSTSLLHTACLALAWALGARGEGLIAFAILLGAMLFVLSIPLAVRVGSQLASRREGALAGALLALSGPVVWAYLYGSDIALFLYLALLLFDRWLALWRGSGALGFAVAGALLALARPEGLLVALVLGMVALRRPGPVVSRRERLLPWVPTGAGLFVLALQRALTGSWLGTSVSEKALLPNYGPIETIAVASKYGVDVLRGLLLGFYPAEAPIGFAQGMAAFAFPPLGLLLVLLAAVRPRIDVRTPARVWLALVFFLFALVGPNVFMGIHFNRYLLWAFPGLLAFVAAGLSVLTRIAARDDEALERGLFRGGAALMLVLGFLSTARFAAAYAEMAGETWRREIPMAEFIRTRLPKGVAIANVATSIEYLTGHRNLNLHGVTSAAFVGNRTAEREAGVFESLVRLAADDRPPWLLITRSGYQGSALMQALTSGPPVFETASFGDDLLLFHTRWELLGLGGQPVLKEAAAATAALDETDRVDVCDAHDERAHAYGYRSRPGEILLAGSVTIDEVPAIGGRRTLADAGRVIFGGESFRIRTRPGRDLVVVLRTHRTVVAQSLRAQGALAVPMDLAEMAIVVRVNGRIGVRLALPNQAGWNEHVFRIPAEYITGATTKLDLSGRYAAFHYWFYQAAVAR